jgi:hypothetical protein
MGRHGGDFALIALSLGAAATAGAVERASTALSRCLRADDACAVSPDGAVVARLCRVGKAEAEGMLGRLATRLEGAPALAGVEATWAAVVFPHDGRDFESLYLRLVRPDGPARVRRPQETVPA